MSAATIPSPAFGTPRHLAQSPGALWGGRVLLAVGVLFLLFDITIKLMVSPEAVEGTTALGYAAHHLPILAAQNGIEFTSLIGMILDAGLARYGLAHPGLKRQRRSA